jgi:hypothetical protein
MAEEFWNINLPEPQLKSVFFITTLEIGVLGIFGGSSWGISI